MEEEKASILVIDDDRSILESLKCVLEMEGYLVDTVETGLEAVEKSKARLYDPAIINSRLPDTTSAELQKRMQTSMSHKRVVMMGMEPIAPAELLTVVKEKLKETPSL